MSMSGHGGHVDPANKRVALLIEVFAPTSVHLF